MDDELVAAEAPRRASDCQLAVHADHLSERRSSTVTSYIWAARAAPASPRRGPLRSDQRDSPSQNPYGTHFETLQTIILIGSELAFEPQMLN